MYVLDLKTTLFLLILIINSLWENQILIGSKSYSNTQILVYLWKIFAYYIIVLDRRRNDL